MLNVFIRIGFMLTWGTIFFIPKKAFKRFLPVTTLSGLLTMIIVFVGTHYRFWEVKGSNKTKILNLLALLLGPFSVGTMWIFKFTYGKPFLYFLTNSVQNLLYAFPIITVFEKMKFLKYVKFTRIHHLIASMTIATILYGYQMFLEGTHRK